MPSDCEHKELALSRRTLLRGGASIALLAGVGLRSSVARANELRVGELAPAASLVTLDGRSISTQDLLGKVVILTFWATWCVPCREELPLLSRYAVKNTAAGLQVLGFCLDTLEKMGDVRHIAESLAFPVGLLGVSSAPGYGRIWRLPVNFTIDRAGVLVEDGWKTKNPTWTEERLEQIVTPLLTSEARS